MRALDKALSFLWSVGVEVLPLIRVSVEQVENAVFSTKDAVTLFQGLSVLSLSQPCPTRLVISENLVSA